MVCSVPLLNAFTLYVVVLPSFFYFSEGFKITSLKASTLIFKIKENVCSFTLGVSLSVSVFFQTQNFEQTL